MNEHQPRFDTQEIEAFTGEVQLQQAAVAAKDMLDYLHDATRSHGMVIEMQTPVDEQGRNLKGSIAPYYMNSGDTTRIYRVQVHEKYDDENTQEVVGRLWVMHAQETIVKLVAGRDEEVSDAGQALAAEFLQAATQAFASHQKAEAVQSKQKPGGLRRALGRIMRRAAQP